MGNNLVAAVVVLHWIAVAFYIASSVFAIGARSFDRPHWERKGVAVAVPGFAAHGLGLLLWWYHVGHGPYIDRFEVLSAYSWILLALYLSLYRRYEPLRSTGVIVYPMAFLLAAAGLLLQPEVRRLPATFRSVWLVMHILFYKIAFAAIVVAGAFSVLYVLKERGRLHGFASLPPLKTLDVYSYRFAGFGFSFWAIGMLAGSIWAYQSWNMFWNWDPVQTWSLVTWLLFGIYLHLRRFYGWGGAKAAWFYIICFLLSVISIFITPFFEKSIHSEYFK